jgi:hypothetical protein
LFVFYSYSRLLLLLIVTLCLFAAPVLAQDEELKPVYLTARLFVVRLPHGSVALTDQLFRLRTPVQAEDEKWLSQVEKAYPEALQIALLRTQPLRLFTVPKPGIMSFGNPNSPHVEFHFLVAQGLREDDTINTMAITEVNLYSGPKTLNSVPFSMATNGFEVEPGMTYFFTSDGLKLKNEVYAAYFRERGSAPILAQYNYCLVLALSLETEKQPILTFEGAKADELQSKALKKIEPQWSDEVKKNQLFGKVQVRVEIGAEGKVMRANIWQSTLPEGNLEALAAARQWEFPTSEMAGINAPASALLTFVIAPAPEPKAAQSSDTKSQGQKTTGKPTTARKPPNKRRKQ